MGFPFGPCCNHLSKRVALSSFKGKRIGIDISLLWFSMAYGTQPDSKSWIYRLIQLLQAFHFAGVVPVIVFEPNNNVKNIPWKIVRQARETARANLHKRKKQVEDDFGRLMEKKQKYDEWKASTSDDTRTTASDSTSTTATTTTTTTTAVPAPAPAAEDVKMFESFDSQPELLQQSIEQQMERVHKATRAIVPTMNPSIVKLIKEICVLFGVMYVDSNKESDYALSSLFRTKQIDLVLTSDFDAPTHDIIKVVRAKYSDLVNGSLDDNNQDSLSPPASSSSSLSSSSTTNGDAVAVSPTSLETSNEARTHLDDAASGSVVNMVIPDTAQTSQQEDTQTGQSPPPPPPPSSSSNTMVQQEEGEEEKQKQSEKEQHHPDNASSPSSLSSSFDDSDCDGRSPTTDDIVQQQQSYLSRSFVQLYDFEQILLDPSINCSVSELREMSFLVGNDYTTGLPGIGIKKMIQTVKQHQNAVNAWKHGVGQFDPEYFVQELINMTQDAVQIPQEVQKQEPSMEEQQQQELDQKKLEQQTQQPDPDVNDIIKAIVNDVIGKLIQGEEESDRGEARDAHVVATAPKGQEQDGKQHANILTLGDSGRIRNHDLYQRLVCFIFKNSNYYQYVAQQDIDCSDCSGSKADVPRPKDDETHSCSSTSSSSHSFSSQIIETVYPYVRHICQALDEMFAILVAVNADETNKKQKHRQEEEERQRQIEGGDAVAAAGNDKTSKTKAQKKFIAKTYKSKLKIKGFHPDWVYFYVQYLDGQQAFSTRDDSLYTLPQAYETRFCLPGHEALKPYLEMAFEDFDRDNQMPRHMPVTSAHVS